MLHNRTNWGFACELADDAICCPLLDENYILPWWFFLKIGCSKVGLRLGVVSDYGSLFTCRSWHDSVLSVQVLKNFFLQGLETFKVILCQNKTITVCIFYLVTLKLLMLCLFFPAVASRAMIQVFQLMFWKTSYCRAWRHLEWYSVKTENTIVCIFSIVTLKLLMLWLFFPAVVGW
jgi:hypothetical protein